MIYDMDFSKNIKISDELTDTTVIWRYCSLEKFFSLIFNEEIYFSKICDLIDEYEGSLPAEYGTFYCTSKLIGGKSNSYKSLRDNRKQDLLHLEQWPKDALKVFVNCWTKHKGESYALWRIYTNINSGIAIKSTVGRLKTAVVLDGNILNISPLDYKPNKNKIFELDTIVTRKKGFYEFENEVRLFVKSDNESLKFKVNIYELISEIILSPLMPAYTKDIVKAIIELKTPKLYEKIKVSAIKIRKNK